MKKLIILVRSKSGLEFPITVPLPRDEQADFTIKRQVADLPSFAIGPGEIAEFYNAIAYLPTTQRALELSEVLWAKGYDWHTACHMANRGEE
jgi:hypothetical protein